MGIWRIQRTGAQWLMDSEERLIGFRDKRGRDWFIPATQKTQDDTETATDPDTPNTGGAGVAASQAEAQGATENTKFMTSLRVKEAVDAYGNQTLLTGISFASSADVTASDSIRSALGKLQAKFNSFATLVRATGMSGIDTATRVVVTAAHTVLQSIGYLQAQILSPWGATTTIASATTPAIGAAATARINMTGTATITGFDTAAPVGAERLVVAAGAFTYQHGASLIVLGAANRTVAVGDSSLWVYEGSGVWREVLASVAALAPGAGGGGGSFTITSQAEAEGATENTKGMTSLRTWQSLVYNFVAAATANSFTAGLNATVTKRLAGIVNAFVEAWGSAMGRPLLVSGGAPNIAITAPATAFGATPTIGNNGGNLQLLGAGAHGLSGTHTKASPSGAINRYIHITTSAGVPSGLYQILSIDSANNLTLNVAYNAATVVTAVARTGVEGTLMQGTIPAGFAPDGVRFIANLTLLLTSSANQKIFRLYLGTDAPSYGATGSYLLAGALDIRVGGPIRSGGVNVWGSSGTYTTTEWLPLTANVRVCTDTLEAPPPTGNVRVAGPAFTPGAAFNFAITYQIQTANEMVWLLQEDAELRQAA